MKKVLVVEDNENNMYLMSYLLNKIGCQVSQAFSGEDGLELAASTFFDLILMDIQLPGINGLDATQKIRLNGMNANTPIIAVTSFAMVGDKAKALDFGCTGYIEKPINPESVMKELKLLLNIL